MLVKMKEKEEERLKGLKEIEKVFYDKGVEYIAGIDEAGRGPLAGPVVVAAVIMPKDSMIEGVNDSKKVSEKKREKLYDLILEEAVSYGIGIIYQEEIDKINILQARQPECHKLDADATSAHRPTLTTDACELRRFCAHKANRF